MEYFRSFLEPRVKPVVACLLVAGLFAASRPPEPSQAEQDRLAARFEFVRSPLPKVAGPIDRSIRSVHPSLRHLAGWISAVGAAVALHDLDGDGLPNDVCYVDTATDQVIVTPAPGTPPRYAPFALSPDPLPFDPRTMAPMGSLPGDFDEDGRPDILVYYWGRSPVLFLRENAGAEGHALARDHFRPSELTMPDQDWYTNAATQADLDGDGHIDLIICNYFDDGSRVLDSTASGRVFMQHSMSRAQNGGANRFFLGSGASRGDDRGAAFREVKGVLAEDVARGWTLAVGACDLDGDLLPEVYFANDFGPDHLLHNRSEPGVLRLAVLRGERDLTTPRSKVLGADSFKGMGVDFGDLNGDGWPDLYVSNIADRYALLESHFLFLSTGRVERMHLGIAPYRDASEALGLSRSGWGWEARLGDFDNDGDLEAMQATGFLKGETNRWPELQELATSNDELLADPRVWPAFGPGDDLSGSNHNPFFVRASDGRYYDLAARLGLTEPMVTRGIATADVDGDGRLDYAVANQWGRSYLYRNQGGAGGQFLGLRLRLPARGAAEPSDVGAGGRRAAGSWTRPAIGAWAAVDLPDGRRLSAAVDGGSGHSGKRAPDLHFGLGAIDRHRPLRVEVRWREAGGRIRTESIMLTPGWHTVLLGGSDPGEGLTHD